MLIVCERSCVCKTRETIYIYICEGKTTHTGIVWCVARVTVNYCFWDDLMGMAHYTFGARSLSSIKEVNSLSFSHSCAAGITYLFKGFRCAGGIVRCDTGRRQIRQILLFYSIAHIPRCMENKWVEFKRETRDDNYCFRENI